MDKNNLIKSLKVLKEDSKKRNFKQTIDAIFNLKELDLKKSDNHVDFFVNLHHERGKKVKVCALVGGELAAEAKKVCDEVVMANDFPKYQKDKKLTKKLADKYDFFIAQANLMGQVAGAFGRVLGPKGKMPNPKAGCVVPPKAVLKPLYDRLQKNIRVNIKTTTSFKCRVGPEEMPDDDVADNIITVYNNLTHHLPKEANNIKNVMIKLSMGTPLRIDDKGNIVKIEEKEKPEEKKEEPKVKEKPKEKKSPKEKPKKEEAPKEEKKEEVKDDVPKKKPKENVEEKKE